MTLVKLTAPSAAHSDGLVNELFNELPLSFGKTLREDVLHFARHITDKKDLYQIELAVPGMDKSDFTR